jgi:DhnA family fructose-bisphosphate aldolase class Ia
MLAELLGLGRWTLFELGAFGMTSGRNIFEVDKS